MSRRETGRTAGYRPLSHEETGDQITESGELARIRDPPPRPLWQKVRERGPAVAPAGTLATFGGRGIRLPRKKAVNPAPISRKY